MNKAQREDQNPPHELVDWSRQRVRGKRPRLHVVVTCPVCHKERFAEASKVAQQIHWGMFTGRCKADRRSWNDDNSDHFKYGSLHLMPKTSEIAELDDIDKYR